MHHILTLIAAPEGAAALPSICRELAARFKTEPDWLADGIACDLLVKADKTGITEAARRLIADVPIDAVAQAPEHRRKRLLVADMDSTIIEQECLDEIADVAGIGPQIAAITERAMRGELAFEAALRERITLLDGFAAERFQNILDSRITLMPGAKTLVGAMTAHGARCVLVSGGFRFFTRAVAAKAGFHADYGNDFVIRNGVISGVAEPILGREAKLDALRREAEAHAISLAETMAVGDGANDLAMLSAAGLGVAYRAKPAVAAAAGACIHYNDLTALLYIQGYRKEEFAQF